MRASLQKQFDKNKCCVLVATYNNCGTLANIISEIQLYTTNIIVVNDGSTDDSLEKLKDFDIELISYEQNIGKGWALQQGFEKARALGYDNCITIDSDGQHFPEDIPKFIAKLEESNEAVLILGNRNMQQEGIPGKSSFGNKFSNFWFWVETGKKQPDTQTGYRLYPIAEYDNMKFRTKKFEFEIEVLVRSAWREIMIDFVDVKIKYFPEEERISHFRPFEDFSRISVLNTVLVTLALIYIKPRDLIRYFIKNDFRKILKEQLTAHSESVEKLSFTLGFGVFMGIVPFWGFQMLIAFFLSQLMKLNKTLVIIAANISLPPLVPFILLGSYWVGGILMGKADGGPIIRNLKNFSDVKFDDFFNNIGDDIIQYVIGAFALALIMGGITFGISWVILKLWKKK